MVREESGFGPGNQCKNLRDTGHSTLLQNPQASVVVLFFVAGLDEEWQILEVLGSR